ncbi:class I SAM-dependent methyltransferase [Patescibacteria group bacterium]|nr:class I SAM-dependent methyltransferase [Patescibacteria group bacterium]
MNDEKNPTQPQLSSSAKLHAREHFYEHDSALAKIKAIFPQTDKKLRILDVGCGDGRLVVALIEQGHTVTGLDINETAIDQAKKRGLTAIKADLESPWPVDSSQYDIILMLDVLEHVVDQNHLLAESRRVLKANGCLIIAYPNHFDIRNRLKMLLGGGIVHWSHTKHENANAPDYSHLRFLRFEDLIQLIKNHGFATEQLQFNFMGGGIIPRRLLPSSVRKWLLRRYPNLLSGKFILRVVKADGKDLIQEKTVLLDKTVAGI